MLIVKVPHPCEVIIIERLPSGAGASCRAWWYGLMLMGIVFSDAVFTDAAVFGDRNLELPSFLSNRSLVEIHMSISKLLARYEDDLELNLERLGLGLWRVEFGQPDLLIYCSIERNVPSRSCLSVPTNHIPDGKTSPVTWEMPCGINEDAGIVSAVTFGFAILTALLIVLTSITYSNSDCSNKLKRS